MKKLVLSAAVLCLLAALPLAPAHEKVVKNASDQGTPDERFKRGATRTPPHKIAEAIAIGKATIYKPVAAPAQVGVIPPKLSYWGNNQYGDCVSAESAAAIAFYSTDKLGGSKEMFVTEATLIAWARSHGVLNGADLLSVCQDMQRDGIKDENGVLRKTGTPASVNFNDEATLQSAIAQGQISIAIAANSLPSGAGNASGWYSFGSRNDHNTDHCVGLIGYGPAKFVFGLLNTPVPANAPTGTLYLCFTWNTVGVIDHAWIKGTTDEGWLRTPTILGLPTPDPTPTPGTVTVTPPTATLAPGGTQQFTASGVVNWTATAGGITGSGLYTAPSAVGSYTVTASLQSDATKTGTATVTVTAAPIPPSGMLTIVVPQPIPTAGTFQLVPPGFEVVPAGTRAKADALEKAGKEFFDLFNKKADADKAVEPKLPPVKDKTPEPPVKEAPKPKEPPQDESVYEEGVERTQTFAAYDAARAAAIRDGKPLVLGVGCKAPAGQWYRLQVGAPWDGYKEACVVVATPERGDLWQRKVYPPGVTANTVSLALGK